MSSLNNHNPDPQSPQRSFVYFISAGENRIKIGVSDSPATRLKRLQTAHFAKLELAYVLRCDNRAHATQLEKQLHEWFKSYRTTNEWFALDDETLNNFFALTGVIVGNAALMRGRDFLMLEQINKQPMTDIDELDKAVREMFGMSLEELVTGSGGAS